ncbi:MAG TPA: Bax inhibitor-1/YccA family protein [Bdellovibrionales bacterium]|nr:Bax inhibitor-1/YccA family protein [Bdellovibrionales bacterium]
MRTGNPALKDGTFQQARSRATASDGVMTISGTVNKTGLLLCVTVATASYTWNLATPDADGAMSPILMPLVMGGLIGGFIVALITVFAKKASPYTAPLYAALEGLALGAISSLMELRYPGIAFQAVLGTFGTLFALLMAYKSGLIRATENFKLGVVAATGGIAIIYLISFVLSFFGITVPLIHDNSPLGIAFTAVVVVIAALNLVLDFDFIEKGEEIGAPKYMEWYAAFGLLVTLIWLYLEILRLLSKSRK